MTSQNVDTLQVLKWSKFSFLLTAIMDAIMDNFAAVKSVKLLEKEFEKP